MHRMAAWVVSFSLGITVGPLTAAAQVVPSTVMVTPVKFRQTRPLTFAAYDRAILVRGALDGASTFQLTAAVRQQGDTLRATLRAFQAEALRPQVLVGKYWDLLIGPVPKRCWVVEVFVISEVPLTPVNPDSAPPLLGRGHVTIPPATDGAALQGASPTCAPGDRAAERDVR